MIDRIKAMFAIQPEEDTTVSPELAAAALMFEVIWADHDIGEKEIDIMRHHLGQVFGTDSHRVDELVSASRILHEESVGLQPFTRCLNEILEQETKYEVVLCLWKIAFADNHLDSLEEHMIRKIADLLYVSHRDFIRAKLVARES